MKGNLERSRNKLGSNRKRLKDRDRQRNKEKHLMPLTMTRRKTPLLLRKFKSMKN
jgi:hypothetical protein